MTTVLIIEDEELLRNEIAEWLGFEDYEVFTAEDGIAGIQKALEFHPDIIVCDVMMPRLDGYGVLREVHAHPEIAETPFIFLTARAAHDDIRMGMSMGADDYLTKPFSRREILQAIEARLLKKDQQQQIYQERVEQLQRALTSEKEHRLFKSKLIAMFAHDFSNPLTAILVSNSMLRDYPHKLNEERRQGHTARIEACVRQLMQMVDDLLVVSKMESGRFDLKPAMIDAGAFFGKMCDEFQAIYDETHTIQFEDNLHQPILSDTRLLQQIGSNLISNAIKYSPGINTVNVSLSKSGDGKQCVLTVQDHGIGIPKADLSRLFEAFQRGSNVGGIMGTGLGLAIVKQAVDLHSGTIQIDSTPGRGTTLTVQIPV